MERALIRPLPVHSLPAAAAPPGRAIQAWELDDGRGYVILVETADGSVHEQEYCTAVGRFLTEGERVAALPPDGPWPLDAFPSLRAVAKHGLQASTGARIVEIRVTDEEGALLSEFRSLWHVPGGPAIDAAIRRALERRRWPDEYRSWSEEERIAHTARQIHRWRRARGEEGLPEAGIFTADLLSDLRRLDPRIECILPQVLERAATLAGEPPERLLAAFAAGTGWSAPRPDDPPTSPSPARSSGHG